MTIKLKNVIHADTDSFGSFKDEWVSLGFVNYGDEGKGYYSYDEVEEMILNGEINEEIFWRDDEGTLHLKESYCSACTCFNIVCGKVIKETKHDNLVKYAKKIGLVHDEFQVVKGWFGDKFIEETDDDEYKITYTFTKEYHTMNLEFAEKLCVGAIKKLAGKRRKIHSKDKVEIEKYFECSNVYFDKDNKILIIEGISKKYVDGEITNTINKLDLELWMLFNENKQWSRFFNAATMCVRDCGQHHWFSRLYRDTTEENEKESNYKWFDKELGKEWL